MNEHPFALFLKEFEPLIEKKSAQVNRAAWILETTGAPDAADLRADLDVELKLLYSDPSVYQKLLDWEKDPSLQDPLLKRQLNVLIRSFKQCMIPKDLLEAISRKEAELACLYANFRPKLQGEELGENQLRERLKTERDPEMRKQIWSASKEVGVVLAPHILSLVELRNRAAKHLGYANYFEMQLDVQEVDSERLLSLFDELSSRSDLAYRFQVESIVDALSKRFGVKQEEVGPWAWSDPFCQEDPLGAEALDQMLKGVDIVDACKRYYADMGFDVDPILQKSDLYERPGKCQHAFCIHMDRRGDIRTLNNVTPSVRWLETVMHELGHAIYETGFDPGLPWLLREPPHMIPTEAMALMAGRQAYLKDGLEQLVGAGHEEAMAQASHSLRRRQLIFCRYVLVMTYFEKELYQDPSQDLNALWWNLVEKFQLIPRPLDRENRADWAAKYHIALAPVYYFSYLLGELFASEMQEALLAKGGKNNLNTPSAGTFLRERLFAPGNRWKWDELIRFVSGQELAPDAWLKEFAKNG